MTAYLQVFTTTAKREDAQRIAKQLTERRLAGCVQIMGPVESTYWWQGKLQTAVEWLCVAKTRCDLYAQAEELIRQIHPYELPEIIAIPISAGSDAYLEWLGGELVSADRSSGDDHGRS